VKLSRKQWKMLQNVVVDETRTEQIVRLEATGLLDPNCPGCRERYESASKPCDVFAPSHKASERCESGGRPHCTCDVCW
jgi:hypothetical protein